MLIRHLFKKNTTTVDEKVLIKVIFFNSKLTKLLDTLTTKKADYQVAAVSSS